MLHKAWNSKEEMPYCFPRSSIRFQGHRGQNITDFDPNSAFPDYRPVAAFKSLRFALFISKYKHIFTVSIISQHWDDTGNVINVLGWGGYIIKVWVGEIMKAWCIYFWQFGFWPFALFVYACYIPEGRENYHAFVCNALMLQSDHV